MFVKLVTKIVFAVLVLSAAIYPVFNPPALKPGQGVVIDQALSAHQSKVVVIDPVQRIEPDKTIEADKKIVAKKMPLPDFSKYFDVKQKKVAFFSYLAPHVKQINSELTQQRNFILGLQHYPTQGKDETRLLNMAKKFKVETELDFVELKHQLLLRVDELPIELVLMQAANESAWGTSRFALDANNLFGQWCFSKGCGVVPSGRPAGEKYEVRKFKHPVDSIRSYYHNLNTGYAYEDLRKIRAKLRKNNKQLDPSVIADGLLSYSTRREAYIEELKSMIRINKKYIKVN
jgi:Bax protein